MRNRLRDKAWYPYTVAACIAVILYVLLANLGTVMGGVRTFLGYFEVILVGCVLAYIINPLAVMLEKRVFMAVKPDAFRWRLSVGAAIVSVILFIALLLSTLIPQLADSMLTLFNNFDGYLESLRSLTEKWGIAETIRIDQIIDSSGNIANQLQKYFVKNANSIVDASAAAGKSVAMGVIAVILSIYLLSSKSQVLDAVNRFLRATIPSKRLNYIYNFLTRCDRILARYILYSLLDAIIIGVVNLLFMFVTGMQYSGLISVIVAVTNLIPTFGPIIGGALGAFILLLVKPLHALIFIVFTFILQLIDPYVIKPKLFGNSLGVSGLLILISVVVCGNMFGIIGILFAIPIAAIIDFIYKEELLPALERRRQKADSAVREAQ